jgi:hypothetical protein
MHYEYRVVPAPGRGEKVRGVKSTADRFALTLTGVMNALGREGWEYLRADTLPCEERVGLTGSKSTFQHLLVFRRAIAEAGAMPMAAPVPLELKAGPAIPRLGPAAAGADAGAVPELGPAVPPSPLTLGSTLAAVTPKVAAE